jgi:hypothetical protein
MGALGANLALKLDPFRSWTLSDKATHHVMRKLTLLLMLFLSHSTWAGLYDLLIDHKEPGFLYYCAVNSEEYEKDLCDEHYNKPYSQDFIRIYGDKNRISADARFFWGKGRESSSKAYGYYDKRERIIKLNSFEDDGWADDADIDENSFFINPCEIVIKREGCFIVLNKISKPNCQLPSSFEMLLKSSLSRIALHSIGRCATKRRNAAKTKRLPS